ncbi:vWA domain-containing protein [Novipirellula artificiosorum]|uniref:von Willebrand factor type A domain protein n=1 Tax=Novipirellula artificiosorum TaxID=2528016 RepID=A0A5C6D6Q1_9BACT|nr:VWA domain-containing protein [Novipirellula artificiosorum]TWU31755.1 von Willebrand factor type A domain protein [Novipirellula artificiosorum]
MILEHPWVLLLLAGLPFLARSLFATEKAKAVRFPSITPLRGIRPSWRQRIAWLPDALLLLGISAMIFALARPRMGREQTVIDSEGIAIEIVVDRSGSMLAMDFQIDGRRVDRLSAIKNVAADFIEGDTSELRPLSGRTSDLIGLVTFAGFADAITPPTLDHSFLLAQLNRTQIVSQQSEDGTAIGDAISLAVDKLDSLDVNRSDDPHAEKASKVIILMTDGENNAGVFDPVQAAELAKSKGIKIYTIGVGTKGNAPYPTRSPFSGEIVMRAMPVNIDEGTLRQIAEATEGAYFRATDTESLAAIYETIDQLEKTKIESHQFTDYKELAVQSFTWRSFGFPPIVLVALVSLAASVLLKQLLFRLLV